MKKTIYFTISLLTIIFLSYCTIHFPYDYETIGRQHKIVFKIVPEDALVLLNGKLIGEAYEFSTWESALRISSKDNELIVKREGFIEEVIDLYEYDGREFIVKVNLKRDDEYKPERRVIRKRELKQKETDQRKKIEGVAVRPKKIKNLEIKSDEDDIIFHKTSLSLSVSPSDAAIYINKKFWGISPKSGRINNIVLRTGKYSLEIIKPGYVSVIKTIIVSGKMKNLDMIIALKKK